MKYFGWSSNGQRAKPRLLVHASNRGFLCILALVAMILTHMRKKKDKDRDKQEKNSRPWQR